MARTSSHLKSKGWSPNDVLKSKSSYKSLFDFLKLGLNSSYSGFEFESSQGHVTESTLVFYTHKPLHYFLLILFLSWKSNLVRLSSNVITGRRTRINNTAAATCSILVQIHMSTASRVKKFSYPVSWTSPTHSPPVCSVLKRVKYNMGWQISHTAQPISLWSRVNYDN